ncbi:MAG: type II secretion system secretin GspD [bacterium]|nr:type II secretion system secretin GspD [bacterium]
MNKIFSTAISLFAFIAAPQLLIAESDVPTEDFSAEQILYEDAFNLAETTPETNQLPPSDNLVGKNSSIKKMHLRKQDHSTSVDLDPTLADVKTDILNVQDGEITELIESISKLTKRTYIVDEAVKGKITIHLQHPVTLEESLRIFDSVLLLKGFTTVPVDQNTWKVIQAKSAKSTTLPLISESPLHPSDILVTQLLRLKHVQAEDMQKLLSQFVSGDGVINSFEGTNALIMIDSAANIARLKKLVSMLDVPAIDQDISIIPVKYADVNDISEKINQILGEKDDKTSDAAATPRVNPQMGRPMMQRNIMPNQGTTGRSASVERRRLPLKVIPDQRTNSLVVVADPELTIKIQALVEKLDSPVDLSGGRFFVHRLRHASAEDLSEILTQLISGASNEEGSKQGASASTANTGTNSQINARARMQETSTATGPGRVQFEGDVSIAPDPATNSLIINASRSDYLRVKQVIDDLDVQRRQVIVEATILEVTLNNNNSMGLEFQGTLANNEAGVIFQTNYGGLTDVLTNPTALSDLSIAAASAGTLTLPGGITIPSQAFLIDAVSVNDNVNVLSSPTILTTDNEEAEIIVGENVPFVTNTSTDPTNLNNTFNQIERQDVGITLRITPQINAGDFVTLKIFVEISNVVAGTRNDANGPTTTKRTTNTVVEVKSNQMIVTGGLISDNITESTRGVPVLMDIPVLGHVFKTEDSRINRTNLLIFLTPRIVSNQYDARETTKSGADRVEAIIQRNHLNPGREEVLHNELIDNVAVELSASEPLPTTITPIRPTKERVFVDEGTSSATPKATQLSSLDSDKFSEQSGDVVEFQVTPVIPPRPALAVVDTNLEQPTEKTQVTAAGSYILLRKVGQPVASAALGKQFPFIDRYGTIGLRLESAELDRFFSPGLSYAFSGSPINERFVCLGSYPNDDSLKEQNASAYAASKAFPVLTAEETRRLWREIEQSQ